MKKEAIWLLKDVPFDNNPPTEFLHLRGKKRWTVKGISFDYSSNTKHNIHFLAFSLFYREIVYIYGGSEDYINEIT